MPFQQLANYVQTTLAAPMLAGDTTATLTSVAGLPTVGNYRLRIDDVAPATTFEYVEVSSVNVGTGVVTFSGGAGVGRGLERTTAAAHAAGAIVGNDLTAEMLQLFFWTSYRASLYRSAAYNTIAGVNTQMPFDAVAYDPNNNTTLGASAAYTVPRTGYYRFSAGIGHTNNAATDRKAQWLAKAGVATRNGSDMTYALSGNPPIYLPFSGEMKFTVGDVLSIWYFSTSAAAINTGANGATFFDICYTGD